ncbi:MAG: DUF3570 domain-containing protein [Bacteroidota bacterium]|nr:DUF3570 domain-containing protein [Bacteroidota bacterium]MDX5506111.1 DUF3570 domain-containing protein [Bacteroidota bacterium]
MGAIERWTALLFLIPFLGISQGYQNQVLDSTEVTLLFELYGQDGDHAAVTGGIGTQKLLYFSPRLNAKIPLDSLISMTLDIGVDVYSSASTDRIDYVMSSASAVDARTHLQVGLSHRIHPWMDLFYWGYGSVESDYRSLGLGIGLTGFHRFGTFVIEANGFWDDCRWGWLEDGTGQELIYPVELRYREWYDTYKRTSYRIGGSVTFFTGKSSNLSLSGDVVHQTGLLATSFHRVYFTDGSLAVENLPGSRTKIPIQMDFRTQLMNDLIGRFSVGYYWDDWDIKAPSLSAEIPIQFSPTFSLSPFYRWYQQQAASWFAPYQLHSPTEVYYTSDYDLSAFYSQKFGLGFRWMPSLGIAGIPRTKWSFRGLECRGGVYLRSDGLQAWFFSSAFLFP